MTWRCVGCDRVIKEFDAGSTNSYTCACGSTIFYNCDFDAIPPDAILRDLVSADLGGRVAMPVSVLRAICNRQSDRIPHLEFLVGESLFDSPRKSLVIAMLMAYGATWMRDCPRCLQDGTYARYTEKQKRLAIIEAETLLQCHNKES